MLTEKLNSDGTTWAQAASNRLSSSNNYLSKRSRISRRRDSPKKESHSAKVKDQHSRSQSMSETSLNSQNLELLNPLKNRNHAKPTTVEIFKGSLQQLLKRRLKINSKACRKQINQKSRKENHTLEDHRDQDRKSRSPRKNPKKTQNQKRDPNTTLEHSRNRWRNNKKRTRKQTKDLKSIKRN